MLVIRLTVLKLDQHHQNTVLSNHGRYRGHRSMLLALKEHGVHNFSGIVRGILFGVCQLIGNGTLSMLYPACHLTMKGTVLLAHVLVGK